MGLGLQPGPHFIILEVRTMRGDLQKGRLKSPLKDQPYRTVVFGVIIFKLFQWIGNEFHWINQPIQPKSSQSSQN
jgi:hypothetical protein